MTDQLTTEHVPSTRTVIDCFLDGAAGEFTEEDFNAWLMSVQEEAWDKGHHEGGKSPFFQKWNPHRVEREGREG